MAEIPATTGHFDLPRNFRRRHGSGEDLASDKSPRNSSDLFYLQQRMQSIAFGSILSFANRRNELTKRLEIFSKQSHPTAG